jgi:hypothetical protein
MSDNQLLLYAGECESVDRGERGGPDRGRRGDDRAGFGLGDQTRQEGDEEGGEDRRQRDGESHRCHVALREAKGRV